MTINTDGALKSVNVTTTNGIARLEWVVEQPDGTENSHAVEFSIGASRQGVALVIREMLSHIEK